MAMYLGLALINHSCEPNCWTYFEHGRTVHVRTLRAIAPGTIFVLLEHCLPLPLLFCLVLTTECCILTGEPLTIAYVNPPAT